MEKPILTLEGLSKFYTSTQNVVVGLNNIRAQFFRGEFVAITGESGSGKSTLAHVLGGVIPYESGEMYVEGHPTSHYDSRDWEHYRRDKISFISQSYGILLSATVMENVVSALRLSGMEKAQAKAEAKTILQKVELWELRGRRAGKLSSGQKQRLSIARALAKPAPILIADEPTGNLDPENSAKIIDLLRQAAQEKLVILITHDFHEAEHCATRRIALQDGKVTMDAPLRPREMPEPEKPRKETKKRPLSGYVSRLQLTGRPVWGSFVLLFFALTAFAVFAFLGTFIVNLDDAHTRVYDDSAFRNGDPLRIVVQRSDGGVFTQEDYDRLLGVKYVTALEQHGFLRDVNYYYIKDEHYRSAYTLVNVGSGPDPVYEQVEELEILDRSHFAQTVPMVPGGDFVSAGRLPENLWEVVVAGDESRIGETFRIHFQDTQNWAISHHMDIDVTVVGVTDFGSGVYLHETVGRMFTLEVSSGGHIFLPMADLTGSDCRMFAGNVKEEDLGKTMRVGEYDLRIAGTHLVACPWLLQMSQEMFDNYIAPGTTTQVSLTIENYAYTKRVLDAVQKMDFIAISPYQLGATAQVQSLVVERLQTLAICAAVLIVVLALQIIVLRALFGSEMENYKLLANIGLTCTSAKRSVFWQVLLFAALGQAVGFAALWYCNRLGIERIVSILRYLPPSNLALLSLVHLAGALAAAGVIAGAVRKRVFPLVASQDDLKLDEEVAQ